MSRELHSKFAVPSSLLVNKNFETNRLGLSAEFRSYLLSNHKTAFKKISIQVELVNLNFFHIKTKPPQKILIIILIN